MKCRVYNCDSRKIKGSNCSFFSFPEDDAVAKKWVEFCRQDKPFNLDTSVICMKHFTDNDYQNFKPNNIGLAKRPLLKRGVVPTIYGYDIPAAGSQPQDDSDKKLLQLYNYEVVLNEEYRPPRSLTSPTRSTVYYDAYLSEVEVLKTEVDELKRENALLKRKKLKEIAKLKRESDLQLKRHAFEMYSLQKLFDAMAVEVKNMEDKLAFIFTTGQIAMLKAGSKRRNWSEEDIAQSISLYAASPKAYRLLYKKGFPLPGVHTLQNWAKQMDITRGLITPVFRLLAATTHMDQAQKLCVLSFDEMKIRQSYWYDVLSDSTHAPVNYVQVAMLRGLMAKWKQPIFYDFDCEITPDLLQSMLQKSQDCGYNAVAVVCDLGDGNKSLFNSLAVTEDQPWFIFNDQKVYVFADVPHLLQLLQHHFLDQGFLINGKPVKKDIILELLSITSADLTITHKISASNLTDAGPHRQSVKTAAKLFSHTIALAITKAASLGHLQNQNWKECFQLFKTTNDWFDLLNVSVPHVDSRKQCLAYGLAIEEQDKVLDEMSHLIKSMRVLGKYSLLPFQKGIIQTNLALKLLFEDIKARFNVNYVLTYRLNQDVLENFFNVILFKGGLRDNPDQQEFNYRLRFYLLGQNKGVLSDSVNVEEYNEPDIELTQPPLTSILLRNLTPNAEPSPVEETEFEDLEFDGLEH